MKLTTPKKTQSGTNCACSVIIDTEGVEGEYHLEFETPSGVKSKTGPLRIGEDGIITYPIPSSLTAEVGTLNVQAVRTDSDGMIEKTPIGSSNCSISINAERPVIDSYTVARNMANGTIEEYVDNEITEIRYSAFNRCYALVRVDTPNVTKIEEYSFQDCQNLVSVNMPKVTSIHRGSFQDCSELVSVDIPHATHIGYYGFRDCYKLKSINAPNVTEIGNEAFVYCDKLTSVDMPKVTVVGEYAFDTCDLLTSVNMPSLTNIGDSAFYACYKLKSINAPNVTKIGNAAFDTCENLTAFVIRQDSKVCTLTGDGVFFNTPIEEGTGYIYVPDKLVENYKVATNWSVHASQIKPLSEYVENNGEV